MCAFRPLPLLFAASLALAACDSAEERAAAHFERAEALVAAGDPARAEVELRNVLELNAAHAPARLAYARLLRDRGEPEAALAQYLRLAEQAPDDVAALGELVELALALGHGADARAHVEFAYTRIPADPRVRGLKATLDFAAGEHEAALAMAAETLAEDPGNVPARLVAIAGRLQAGDAAGARAEAEAGLARSPADESLLLARLAAIEEAGDDAAVGAALAEMAERLPDNPDVRRALARWHLGAGDAAAAEAELRALAAAAPDDPQAALAVVRFLLETDGAGAARAELERLVATAADPAPFRRTLAGLDFAEGRTDTAIAGLRALVDAAAPSDARRDTEVALAGMLDATGDAAGRDALVAAVLAADPTHVAALKLRARAAIAADRPEQAVEDMRTALAQAPDDPEIMTLQAMAHARAGSRDLAGERLARAVEASGRAPAESLRYAAFLLQDGRDGPAEGVVADALRAAPGDPDLIAMLGDIQAGRGDWARVRQTADRLRAAGDATGDPAAATAADGLEVAALRGEGRDGEAVALLERLAAAGDPDAMAEAVRGHLEAGGPAVAQAFLAGLLARDPASPTARLLQAELLAEAGDPAAAEAAFRALIAEGPARPEPHRALAGLLAGLGRPDEARAAVEAGLAATGGDPGLLFVEAGLLEADGDVDGAIAAYEALYARDGEAPVVANNLASLLAGRGDAEGLARAFAIARRLEGSELPHFRDTWGWILHRRGESARALPHLEAAAEALPGNAQVQFHLGEAALALGDRETARASFERALAAADAGSPLPEAAAVRARLAEIEDPGKEG